MSSKKNAVSSVRAGNAPEKSTDKLRCRVYEKAEGRAITFSKEQFNAGLRFPLPALFKEFLHFSQIPPAFIHPNIIRHVRSPALPSIGDGVAGLDEGGAKGHVVVRGACAGLLESPGRPFSPNYSTVLPGPERRGHIVDWVEKASFACLNKLFEIDAKERHYKTLLSARNLMAVVRESQICRQYSPQEAAKGEEKNEGTLRKAPGQKRGAASPPKKAPAKKRKLVKNGKGVKEPTPPKEFVLPPITHEAEVIIEEPVNPSSFYLKRTRTRRGAEPLEYLLAVARLANLAEEAASINHPAPLIRMSMQLKPFVRPRWRKRAESQSQPSDDPDRLALVLVKGPPSKRRVRRAI
ncbi:hypothetical protein CK203_057827 [Vitis vinifera]|uniref:Uncharacterized protein n=1 Tax=Vitis vinifera TaxID=29760 RepID=A0A438GFR2_VITVI|nr:hypothetical protein CK203_057827 [Vitis vinifera]